MGLYSNSRAFLEHFPINIERELEMRGARSAYLTTLNYIHDVLPDGPEKKQAIERLRESQMWAIVAIQNLGPAGDFIIDYSPYKDADYNTWARATHEVSPENIPVSMIREMVQAKVRREIDL